MSERNITVRGGTVETANARRALLKSASTLSFSRFSVLFSLPGLSGTAAARRAAVDTGQMRHGSDSGLFAVCLHCGAGRLRDGDTSR